MLQNAYSLAKIGADTAENERHFAEICQKLATTLRVHYPRRRGALPRPRRGRPGDDAVERRVVVSFRQILGRFRLYRRRSLQVDMRFAAFFKIYQII